MLLQCGISLNVFFSNTFFLSLKLTYGNYFGFHIYVTSRYYLEVTVGITPA